MGTADYMSPEQARGKAVDARTDIFSFGIMLFEMLTGQKPFTGETINHTIVNILEKKSPSVFDFIADCPADLEHMIRKAMAKDLHERFQSAKELLLSLKNLQKSLNFKDELRRTSQSFMLDNQKAEIFHAVDGKTSTLPPNNLTENLSPIIGREKEISEISELFKSEDIRLLTLTGIGGTGKTRLAQTVAKRILNDFRDGVFFIVLASITDPKIVISTIAQTLGVKESGDKPIIEVLKNYLRGKKMLLVIDNFEQVIEAALDIAELIAASDDLKILVTSREFLNVKAEREFAVLPLAVPSGKNAETFEELSNYEAVRFFVERAKFAQSNFELTEENCMR